MSFIGLLGALTLGLAIGGAGGIVIGFVWYERKCGLVADNSDKLVMAIRAELDDVMDRLAYEKRPWA